MALLVLGGAAVVAAGLTAVERALLRSILPEPLFRAIRPD